MFIIQDAIPVRVSGGIGVKTTSCNHHVTGVFNHQRRPDYTVLCSLRNRLEHLSKRLLCLLIGCFRNHSISGYVNASDGISCSEGHYSVERSVGLEDYSHSLIKDRSTSNIVGKLIAYLIDQFPYEERSGLRTIAKSFILILSPRVGLHYSLDRIPILTDYSFGLLDCSGNLSLCWQH